MTRAPKFRYAGWDPTDEKPKPRGRQKPADAVAAIRAGLARGLDVNAIAAEQGWTFGRVVGIAYRAGLDCRGKLHNGPQAKTLRKDFSEQLRISTAPCIAKDLNREISRTDQREVSA